VRGRQGDDEHRKELMRANEGDRLVRVRFAPSPTGHLHVGGARTAIFNWLFARHAGGRFVLRIEDTDVERSTKESEKSLLEDLEWLGLDWDEGPGKGGPFAPYRQSERIIGYKARAEELVAAGRAYPCFCSDEDLERKRSEALARGAAPHYDGTCRGLDPAEVERKRADGIPEVIRFRVREGEVWFEDCIRGGIEFSTSMVGDFVLIRSNGLPTYNFAAVVDDHAMGMTHVLRGEEHLPNTLRQILLYEAFGWEAPVFGHLPLILGEDRSKLSKRHGASSVAGLRDQGFLAGAVVNYLALLGWSHSSEREILSMDELVSDFSLARVGKSPAVFDMKKLRWMNGVHLRNMDEETLFGAADGFLPEDMKRVYPEEQRRVILGLLREKVDTLSELADYRDVFMDDFTPEGEAEQVLKSEESKAVLRAMAKELSRFAGELTPQAAKDVIKRAGKESGTRGKELYFPLRAAITGSVHGPDLAGVIAVKGKERVQSLVEKALLER